MIILTTHQGKKKKMKEHIATSLLQDWWTLEPWLMV
jgi:hypothetical protein